jgi:hypothetical protein
MYHCSVIFYYMALIFAKESAAEAYLVTWNRNHSVLPYIEIMLNLHVPEWLHSDCNVYTVL